MLVAALALVSALWSAVADAEIYAWRDASGVRHFTNVREEIPESYRDRAEVVVGAAWAASQQQPPPSCDEETPRQAQVVIVPRARGDRRRSTESGVVPLVVQGGNVHLEGPLVMALAPPTLSGLRWPVVPLVTTAFDRGRSRHLTLRQLAEEERWLWETWGWSPGLPRIMPFAGGPRPPCVAWRTCQLW
ncbi:MAG: DUF4124 domain-containing protein [Candidatus Binatia bacterium]|nr:DUF4124 domain-containing protein [Candidatus Binatia bacterium]